MAVAETDAVVCRCCMCRLSTGVTGCSPLPHKCLVSLGGKRCPPVGRGRGKIGRVGRKWNDRQRSFLYRRRNQDDSCTPDPRSNTCKASLAGVIGCVPSMAKTQRYGCKTQRLNPVGDAGQLSRLWRQGMCCSRLEQSGAGWRRALCCLVISYKIVLHNT